MGFIDIFYISIPNRNNLDVYRLLKFGNSKLSSFIKIAALHLLLNITKKILGKIIYIVLDLQICSF